MYKVDTRNAYECEKHSHENLESKCANSFNSRRTFDSKSQFIEFFLLTIDYKIRLKVLIHALAGVLSRF